MGNRPGRVSGRLIFSPAQPNHLLRTEPDLDGGSWTIPKNGFQDWTGAQKQDQRLVTNMSPARAIRTPDPRGGEDIAWACPRRTLALVATGAGVTPPKGHSLARDAPLHGGPSGRVGVRRRRAARNGCPDPDLPARPPLVAPDTPAPPPAPRRGAHPPPGAERPRRRAGTRGCCSGTRSRSAAPGKPATQSVVLSAACEPERTEPARGDPAAPGARPQLILTLCFLRVAPISAPSRIRKWACHRK